MLPLAKESQKDSGTATNPEHLHGDRMTLVLRHRLTVFCTVSKPVWTFFWIPSQTCFKFKFASLRLPSPSPRAGPPRRQPASGGFRVFSRPI